MLAMLLKLGKVDQTDIDKIGGCKSSLLAAGQYMYMVVGPRYRDHYEKMYCLLTASCLLGTILLLPSEHQFDKLDKSGNGVLDMDDLSALERSGFLRDVAGSSAIEQRANAAATALQP
eukprot:SAG22_NODE_975_length_6203_cov_25.423001_3_plen_118_part_00